MLSPAPLWHERKRPVPGPPAASCRESHSCRSLRSSNPVRRHAGSVAAASAIRCHQFVNGGEPPFTLSPTAPRPKHSFGRIRCFLGRRGKSKLSRAGRDLVLRPTPLWHERKRPLPGPPAASRRESHSCRSLRSSNPVRRHAGSVAAASAIRCHQFVNGGEPPFTLSPTAPRPKHSFGRIRCFLGRNGDRDSLGRGVISCRPPHPCGTRENAPFPDRPALRAGIRSPGCVFESAAPGALRPRVPVGALPPRPRCPDSGHRAARVRSGGDPVPESRRLRLGR